jgi:endonuclease/exonuclease/phosphatase family metal-dependent hydrolase
VLGWIEVENRTALQRFDKDILDNFFDDTIVVDGNDPRGIDVAAATRKSAPIRSVRTNVLARDDKGYVFSRDCLEIEVRLGSRPVFVLVNHFKAKDRFPIKSDAKRKRQAEEVRRILTKRYDLKTDHVIVLGDFNDEPENAPLRPLITTPNLLNVWDVVGRPDDDRWTYYFGGSKQFNKIDMILVSKALAAKVRGAGIERRGIADLEKITEGREKSFPEVTSWRVSASDHAAVWVDLKS